MSSYTYDKPIWTRHLTAIQVSPMKIVQPISYAGYTAIGMQIRVSTNTNIGELLCI